MREADVNGYTDEDDDDHQRNYHGALDVPSVEPDAVVAVDALDPELQAAATVARSPSRATRVGRANRCWKVFEGIVLLMVVGAPRAILGTVAAGSGGTHDRQFWLPLLFPI